MNPWLKIQQLLASHDPYWDRKTPTGEVVHKRRWPWSWQALARSKKELLALVAQVCRDYHVIAPIIERGPRPARASAAQYLASNTGPGRIVLTMVIGRTCDGASI